MATFAQFKQFGPYYEDGDLVSAGFVYHYAAGTTTLLDVYTDRTKVTAAAQPLEMDANGVVGCYCDGVYKFEIQDANGDTLYTFDNVSVVDQTTATGKGADLASASTLTLGTDGDEFLVTGTTTILALSGAQTEATLVFNAAVLLTHSATLILQNAYSYTTSANDVLTFVNEGSDVWREKSRIRQSPTRGHIHGLTLSTAGSSATMSVAAGVATDSTYTLPIVLASSLGKTTSGWGVGTGNGALDTGAIANSTWYHWYVIYRSDTGVVDVLCSLSASAPTMPTNYTHKRRIGAGRTNGSAQWTSFVQDGDLFQWLVPLAEANVTNPGTSAVTLGLIVPTGVNVLWNGTAGISNTSGADTVLMLTDLATTDTSPAVAPQVAVGNHVGNQASFAPVQVRTNTSAQIRYRISASSASTAILINTIGWFDRRGRDS